MRSGEVGHYLKPRLSGRTWAIAGAVILALHFLPWVTPTLMHLIIMMFLFAIMGQGGTSWEGMPVRPRSVMPCFMARAPMYRRSYTSVWGSARGSACWFAIAIGSASAVHRFPQFPVRPQGALLCIDHAGLRRDLHMVTMGWPAVGGSSGLLIPWRAMPHSRCSLRTRRPFIL